MRRPVGSLHLVGRHETIAAAVGFARAEIGMTRDGEYCVEPIYRLRDSSDDKTAAENPLC